MTIQTEARQKLNRREFLSWLWGASLVGLFGQAAAALVQFFKPRLEPEGFGREVVAGALWFETELTGNGPPNRL